jgi:anti-anti-sigma factor
MQITFQKQRGEVLILLNGTLDGSTACEIEHAMQPLRESGGMRLIFDFSGVRKVEYFGVAIFAKVVRGQRSQFREISFAGLRPASQKLFKRFGLPDSQLPPADSLGEATTSEVSSWQTS